MGTAGRISAAHTAAVMRAHPSPDPELPGMGLAEVGRDPAEQVVEVFLLGLVGAGGEPGLRGLRLRRSSSR